jgi:hypothetical protein
LSFSARLLVDFRCRWNHNESLVNAVIQRRCTKVEATTPIEGDSADLRKCLVLAWDRDHGIDELSIFTGGLECHCVLGRWSKIPNQKRFCPAIRSWTRTFFWHRSYF